LIEVSVINEEPLRIIVVSVDDRRSIVAGLFGDGVSEFAAGSCTSIQDFGECCSAFLSRDTGPHDRYHIGAGENGFQNHRPDTVNHDDGLGVHRCDRLHQCVAVVPRVEVVAVACVAFDCDVAFTGVRINKDNGVFCIFSS